MTRRDFIIIAVLVNAGLLAILFMMAINSNDDKMSDFMDLKHPPIEISSNEPPASTTLSEPAFTPMTISPSDEGDNALKDFNTTPAPLPVISEEPSGLEPGQEEIAKQETETQAIEEVAEPIAEQKEPAKKTIEVTVKRGDSLDKIARANGTTVKAIKNANNLKSERLDIGQVLKVPVGTKKETKSSSTAKKSTTSKPASSQVAQADAEYYTIKNGDNPWKIAKQFKVKVDDLLKLNNLNEEKARNLKAGDKIRVR